MQATRQPPPQPAPPPAMRSTPPAAAISPSLLTHPLTTPITPHSRPHLTPPSSLSPQSGSRGLAPGGEGVQREGGYPSLWPPEAARSQGNQ